MKNGDGLRVQEQDVSQVEETNEIKELFRAISENAPKSGNKNGIIDMGNLKKHVEGLEERNNEAKISEGGLAVVARWVIANSKKRK